MNRHGALDALTVRATAALVGPRIFSRRLESPPLAEHLDAVRLDRPPLTPGTHELVARTLVGRLPLGLVVAEWHGPDAPTLLYHHGSGERPDADDAATNSFRDVVRPADGPLGANCIAIRAAFHDVPSMAYLAAMESLDNFAAMVAASAALAQAVVEGLDGPAAVSGISLGGFVTNFHRAAFDTADAYVPMLAGAAPDLLFTASAYRHLTAPEARSRPGVLREVLNFEAAYDDAESGGVAPLLARYDRLVEYDEQRGCYDGMDLRTVEKGHVTAAVAHDALRAHLLDACADVGAAR
ncbi:hypothetical protein [Halomarina pelagica]|uniref:hypothetical protein n=1 Tax=Halomarina pelagica TaxID=2961599 RepID=UPI0020C40B8F|nr:hypothetical protein [Halomarina sp. BND7]